MSVNTLHPEYIAYASKWKRCRDVISGSDALKQTDKASRSGTYIARLTNQSDTEYHAYLERSSFFGASGRTVDGLAGMMFGKPIEYEAPEPVMTYLNDISLSGLHVRDFTQQVAYEELEITRVGILTDYPAIETAGMTRAQAESINLRPYARIYKGESIINWRTSNVNGKDTLGMVTLKESVQVFKNDFESESKDQYRVLDLFEGSYRIRLFNDKGEQVSESFPKMNGQVINFIPFVIVGGNEIRKPLLLDLIDLNLSHYRNSADYEHGLHFVGLPTPYVSGVQLSNGDTLQIGSTSAWVFSDPQAKAGFLEFQGQGLDSIKNAMTDKQVQMSVLGAKMLSEDKKAAEATDTLSMRTNGERSILAATAYDIMSAMKQTIEWMCLWSGVPAQVKFTINTDYEVSKMTPQMMQQLVSAWQTDAITTRTMLENLKRGGVLTHETNLDDYEELLSNSNSRIL